MSTRWSQSLFQTLGLADSIRRSLANQPVTPDGPIMSPVAITVSLVTAGWVFVAALRTRRYKRSLRNLGIEGVRYWLERLYESRQQGAYLIFEDLDGSERFVQFRREVGDAGASLTCDFPIAVWSSSYVRPLKRLLDQQSIDYGEEMLAPDNAVSHFIVVANLDSTTATTLTDMIFRQVFGDNELAVRVWGNHIAPERVARPVAAR